MIAARMQHVRTGEGELARVKAEQERREQAGRCPCGCGHTPAAGSKYAVRDRCRMRAYRQRLHAEAQDRGAPAKLSLGVLRDGGSESRNRDGQNARPRPQRRRAPELRISFRRAVEAVNCALASYVMAQGVDADAARQEIEDALADALTARQRDALARVRAREGHVTGGGFR